MNIFKRCPPSVIQELLPRFQLDIFLDNDIIYREGDEADCLYYLKCGTVAVYVQEGSLEVIIFIIK